MNQLTNNAGFSLAVAVWLAHDEYTSGSSEHAGKNLISATSLLKPTRQLVLGARLEPEENVIDVTSLISSRFGNAIHDSIEHAWLNGYQEAMTKLGYPKKVIDRVRINPPEGSLKEGDIPVYLEQRYYRSVWVDGVEIVISGKFDQIINGEVNDTKTTSVYTYLNNTKVDDYQLQGSIYRWINPDKVTSDIMKIQHVFTDWQRSMSKSNPKYPAHRLVEFSVNLLSLEETERWIKAKIREIRDNQALPEPEIIHCTDAELWKSDPVYKYYSDPKKAEEGGRSTRNFDNLVEAQSYRNQQGKGVVVTVPGKVKACGYCSAFPICTQKDAYDHDNG